METTEATAWKRTIKGGNWINNLLFTDNCIMLQIPCTKHPKETSAEQRSFQRVSSFSCGPSKLRVFLLKKCNMGHVPVLFDAIIVVNSLHQPWEDHNQ